MSEVFVPLTKRESINMIEVTHHQGKYLVNNNPFTILRLKACGAKPKKFKVKKETDVLECLKKFKSGALIYSITNNTLRCKVCEEEFILGYHPEREKKEVYCKNCWFKECFGELPKKELKQS